MRISIISLISRRELRDLLRDRRTVLLILLLPVVLYPFFGLAGWLFAQTLTEQTSRVGIVGVANLPGGESPLLEDGNFAEGVMKPESKDDLLKLEVVPLDGDSDQALKDKTVDVVLVVPPGFAEAIATSKLPTLTVLDRDADEKSKLAAKRLNTVLRTWAGKLREQKFVRDGKPKDYDRMFELKDPQSAKPAAKKAADELRDTLVKAFPFILMMWLVAGVIQPSVDLTAGEKERGTMETLLISPAERSEIVMGKFVAVCCFTFASVMWNVLWLSGAAFILETSLGEQILNYTGMIGCLLLAIPLAMFFSAVSLVLGVFARSTKEGQYYLMPLMLITMPLAFASMMPATELTVGRAIMPVMGAMLMQQKFLSVSADPIPWTMLVPVLGSLAVCIGFALWLAVVQFNRESVLFRETGPEKRGLLKRWAKR